jgi:hypothetical protein
MRFITRIQTMTVAALLMGPTPMLRAQTVDPVGHYEATISSPAGELTLQIDLTKTANGDVAGTLTIPAQKLKGLPLTNVVVKGQDVSFDIATSGGGYFRGQLEGNGISGEFSMQMGSIPLVLERAGEARTYALPPSAAIGKELEGAWKGTLDVDGGMRVALNLANQADGTSSGNFVSVDENNLSVPVVIVQEGTKLTLTLPMVGSSYAGTVNAAGTEVSGTYTTSRGLALPLSLKRSATN